MPLTEQQIRNIVQQELRQFESSSRFQVKSIPQHIHNGTDAPQVFSPIISYVGIIITCTQPATLPTGWQFARLGTGSVQIAHNINSIDQLVWVASPLGAGGATIPVPIITPGTATATFPSATGVVEFDWFDVSATGGGANVDATFYFIGVQTNNRKPTLPPYTVF